MEIGTVAEIGEHVLFFREGCDTDPRHASPPIWVNVSVLRSIHSAMKWQPMPQRARLPSGTLVEVLCGQPEQKYGVRLIGRTGCICVASRR